MLQEIYIIWDSIYRTIPEKAYIDEYSANLDLQLRFSEETIKEGKVCIKKIPLITFNGLKSK